MELRCFLAGALPKFECFGVSDSLNLHSIQSAHAYNRDSTEQPEPINMGPNFFLDAEGQSEDEDNDLSKDESENTDSDSNNNSSEGDENSDRSGEDSDPPYPSDEDDYDSS